MNTVAMTSFTPTSAAVGGLLIGLAAAFLMLSTGRIAGISGFLSRLLPPYSDRDWFQRLAFVAGLIAAPWLYHRLTGTLVTPALTASTAVLIVAGLLVGAGTVVGSGCTSGHGVCGLARLSPRSIAATTTFTVTATATVFVVRHLIG